MERFTNRRDAGRLLAQQLIRYARRPDVLVLALPRGGVPVGYEVATALHVPLDVIGVRKIGSPHNAELAIGAVASGGAWTLDFPIIRQLGVGSNEIDEIVAKELRELRRRERVYRDNRPLPDLHGRVVILIDDGLATGASMRAAVKSIRQKAPMQIIVATPVASVEAVHAMHEVADDCVALLVPVQLHGVGMYYRDFTQTTDDEVMTLLRQAAEHNQADARATAS